MPGYHIMWMVDITLYFPTRDNSNTMHLPILKNIAYFSQHLNLVQDCSRDAEPCAVMPILMDCPLHTLQAFIQ